MKTKLLITFYFIYCIVNPNKLNAQKEGNIWYFGQGIGLDFTNCSPIVLTDGNIDGFEGCSTICDKNTGQLLFYTNSDKVWSRNHVMMPNGDLLPSTNSISQVLIVPKPSTNNIYYIFTTDCQANAGYGLRYHIVDMNQNSLLGDVASKNNLLCFQYMTEKMTAIKHSNGIDTWIITHICGSNSFYSYLLTNSGISTSPVVSSIGKTHLYDLLRSNWDAMGEIKASPNGKKIAVSTYDQPDIELFDFNTTTGILSNQILLPEIGASTSGGGNFSRIYGVSFSQNNSVLYASVSNSTTKLIQYDISSGNSLTINNSKQLIYSNSSGETIFDLKLSQDGKIYTGGDWRSYLGVINDPNNLAANCNFVYNGLYLNGKLSGFGLNNLIEQTYFCFNETSINNTNEIKQEFSVYPNPTAENININLSQNIVKGEIVIYNLLGKLQFKSIINNTSHQIDVSAFANGIYIIEVLGEDNIIGREKFIKN